MSDTARLQRVTARGRISEPKAVAFSSIIASEASLLHELAGAFLWYIIESVDSISKDERGFPLTQYITNGRISRDGYTFTHFKHHHRVLRLISYSMNV